MEKSSIRWEHSLASLRCLRAGFNIFSPHFPKNDRQIQIIRGVWGFLPFATEFWAVDLQELAATPVENRHPGFDSIASELSSLLATSQTHPDAAPSGRLIEELEPIRSRFPGLWYDATLSLEARASGRHRVVVSGNSGGTPVVPGIGSHDHTHDAFFLPLFLPTERGAWLTVVTRRQVRASHTCASHFRELRSNSTTCRRNPRPLQCHIIRVPALLRQF